MVRGHAVAKPATAVGVQEGNNVGEVVVVLGPTTARLEQEHDFGR